MITLYPALHWKVVSLITKLLTFLKYNELDKCILVLLTVTKSSCLITPQNSNFKPCIVILAEPTKDNFDSKHLTDVLLVLAIVKWLILAST